MTKELSLLDKAKNRKIRKTKQAYTTQEIELVEAYIDSEIGLTDIMRAKEFRNVSEVYVFICNGVRVMFGKDRNKK